MKYTLPDEREKLKRINRRLQIACIAGSIILIFIPILTAILLTLTRIK